MNKLLELSFSKYGYDANYLKDIMRVKYNDGYVFRDEGGLILKLKEIHDNYDKIVVFPDFDMDGISAGAIFYAGLSLLGFNVKLYIPEVNRGYGLSKYDLDRAFMSDPDVKAVLTCDVGITCSEFVKYAKSRDLTVLITDHHPEVKRVGADFIVDPSRLEQDCDFRGVCGAYVAYHVIMTYVKLLGNQKIIDLCSKLSIFAALGSCGDLMPVIYDTRKVIQDGLREFNLLLDADDTSDYIQGVDSKTVFYAVFDNLRKLHFYLMRNNIIQPGDVTHVDFGFTYCPLFNSVKRMGGDLNKLYLLLYEPDNDRFGEIADWLIDLNNQRKKIVQNLYLELTDNNRAYKKGEPYIYLVDCLPGLCGLLAMKLMDFTGYPCLVVTEHDGFYSGSGRVPAWFDRKVLEMPGVKLEGHDSAFGVTIQKDIFESLISSIDLVVNSYVTQILEENKDEEPDIKNVIIRIGDAKIDKYDFDLNSVNDFDTCFDFALELESLRPFGTGFEEPEFMLGFGPNEILKVSKMGKNEEHLKVFLKYNIALIVWNGVSKYFNMLNRPGNADRVFWFNGKFSINEFNGNKSLQFIAK